MIAEAPAWAVFESASDTPSSSTNGVLGVAPGAPLIVSRILLKAFEILSRVVGSDEKVRVARHSVQTNQLTNSVLTSHSDSFPISDTESLE